MKRHLIFLLIIFNITILCTSCGDNPQKTDINSITSVTTSTSSSVAIISPGKESPTIEEDSLLVAKSEDPFNFCTKYSEDYSYKWDPESGITIFTETPDSIPYVLVWRSFDQNTTATSFHDAEKSEMNYYYGSDLISVSEPKTYSLGGKDLSGVEYAYKVGEYTVEMLRLIDESPKSGYVLYTAKYLDSSKDKTLEALETAIANYRSGKKAYEVSDGQEPDLEIVPSVTQNIQYETHYDGWFHMEIPKGWSMDAVSFNGSAAAFLIHAYDSNNPDIQIFTAIQTLSFSSEKAYEKLCAYPLAGSEFKGVPYLLGGENPVYELFQNFEVFRSSQYGRYMSLSPMYGWTAIEEFGQTPLGGELIRASYKNEEGKEIEGIFSAKWMKGITMYGYNYPGAFYSPMFFTAPADDFNEWEEILNHCLSTFEYTENYIDAYYSEEKATMKAFTANTQIYNEMSEMITSSWQDRQTTYDIISEKQSDATLGYDRVYNTETNEIYRVTSGFMDSYSGSIYKEIEESMYTLPITGYIY